MKKRISAVLIISALFILSAFVFIPEPVSATFAELPSAKDTVASDTTTSATYEDVDGLTVSHIVDDTSDILLFASIQVTGSAAAQAGWKLVYDGTDYLDLERQIGAEPGNILLTDLVSSKGAGTYTFKLQHKVATGTLTTANSIIVAVSLHDGTGAVPAISDYVASDTVGNAWEDIPGLTQDITISATSHIWALMTFNGYHSASNKDSTIALNIDGTRYEENKRDYGVSMQYGCSSGVTRTTTALVAGTYTVKGEWKGVGGSTLTGEDFKLVAIGAEAQSGTATIDIQKDLVLSDQTTATTIEDIDGLSVSASLDGTSHVLAVMTMDSDVNTGSRSAYTTISIDSTDYDVMERGHVSGTQHGSIGQVVRTTSTLSSGSKTVQGRWYTDAATTLTGANIVLTSIVLGTNVAVTPASLTVTLRKSDNQQERIAVGYFGNVTFSPGDTEVNSTNFVRAQCDDCDGVDDSFWINWSGTTWSSVKVGDPIDIDSNFRFYYNEVTGAGEDPDDGGWTWTDSGVDADGDYQITFANSGTTYVWVRFRIEAIPDPFGMADDFFQDYTVELDR